jgi:hypothetical protein
MENERSVKYTQGSSVRICSLARLQEFLQTGRYRRKIEPQQFAFAGQIAMVKWSGLYEGGGFVYQLDGVPGLWHEQLLESVSASRT